MTRGLPLCLALTLWAAPALAQQTAAQKVADVASYGTWAAAIVVDIAQGEHTPRALATAGLRYGATALAVATVKHYFPAARPCAPQCGVDNPMADIPSGHTAFALAALDTNGGGRRVAVGVGLGTLTAVLRMRANKHDLAGVAVGAGLGLLTGQIR
jgi:hypothetical protein